MKKKVNFSIFTVLAIIVGIVATLYFFLYLAPVGQERTMIEAETMLFNAQAKLIEPYLEDQTPLEEKIADIETAIAEMHATSYTNESTFNTILAGTLQSYQLELTSLTLGAVTNYQTHTALPINLELKGSRQNVMNFISFFENNTDGSYVVNSANMQYAGNDNCTLAMVMYLCNLAVQ